MTVPQPIPRAVRAMVPMLGSPVDAEALGACRGIGRKLTSVGLDWHALAAAIRTGEPGPGDAALPGRPNGPTWDDAAWSRARPRQRRVYAFTPAQSREHRRMALWVRNNDRGHLSTREREFIATITHQRRELTIGEADRLAVICDRLVMEARAC